VSQAQALVNQGQDENTIDPAQIAQQIEDYLKLEAEAMQQKLGFTPAAPTTATPAPSATATQPTPKPITTLNNSLSASPQEEIPLKEMTDEELTERALRLAREDSARRNPQGGVA
jgi:hypothetical protein